MYNHLAISSSPMPAQTNAESPLPPCFLRLKLTSLATWKLKADSTIDTPSASVMTMQEPYSGTSIQTVSTGAVQGKSHLPREES